MKNLILICIALISVNSLGEKPKPPGSEGKTIAQLQATLKGERFIERKINILVQMARLYSSQPLTKKLIPEAKSTADRLLKIADLLKENWDYGNAIHHGNLVLGRIELANGNVASAKEYLLKAGKTRGSPQLDTFGPNMTLAKELLEKNEKAVVLEYLESVKYFWEREFSEPAIRKWTEDIRTGRNPDFAGNLVY